MACGLSANSCCSSILFFHNKNYRHKQRPLNLFNARASSVSDEDCNVEECAPDKEVGKVSMEWLAGEKTKVVGIFPPRTRGWTGYVEKDTAGQTNIYSVEPAVYVAESAFSSGNAGTSTDGSENTVAIAAGLALIFIAGASFVVLQVGKKPTPVQTLEYSGPLLATTSINSSPQKSSKHQSQPQNLKLQYLQNQKALCQEFLRFRLSQTPNRTQVQAQATLREQILAGFLK